MSEKRNLVIAVPLWGVFLLLLFVVFGGISMAFLQWRATQSRQGQRMRFLIEEPPEMRRTGPLPSRGAPAAKDNAEKISDAPSEKKREVTLEDARHALSDENQPDDP